MLASIIIFVIIKGFQGGFIQILSLYFRMSEIPLAKDKLIKLNKILWGGLLPVILGIKSEES